MNHLETLSESVTQFQTVKASAIHGTVIAISFMPCDPNRDQDIYEVHCTPFALPGK